ncbi:MAG: metallophosphoesterase family protein [Planctomycetota bacterium]|jgi:predicted phosphodiesterase
MIAVISDIHSNLDALSAVLEDIGARNVEQIICLGDVVGYGPQPKECLDLVMEKVSITLMGNHDYAVLYEPSNFNIGAENASFWTRRILEDEADIEKRNARWDFLGSLPVKHTLGGDLLGVSELTFVHGSPRKPTSEYIFPDDVYNNPNKVNGLFDRFNDICFVGHTHVPGVIFDAPDFYSSDELDMEFEVDPGHKALVNVGSVGQPRDRDNRASYVLIEPGVVQFVRVSYAFENTLEKVLEVPELDNYLGIRLKEGR